MIPPGSTKPCAEIVLIDDPAPHDAWFNMALDEALLVGAPHRPLLRCYRWLGPAASFGCFGVVADVRRTHPALPVVRRWTGGGIVRHGQDFTFTLIVPRGWKPAALTVAESYRAVHVAVATAVRISGIAEPELWPAVNEAGGDPSRPPPHFQGCFTNPVPYDLLANGEKIAGGAQRRTRHGLIHQGSIQGSALPDLSAGYLWELLRDGLADALAETVTRRPVSPSEIARAADLVLSRYQTDAWTERH